MSEIIYPDEAKARVRELLSQLARLTDARDLRIMDRQQAIHDATPEDVRVAIRDINAEFDEHLEAVNAGIVETEAELRTVGVFTGETVTDANAGYQIVFIDILPRLKRVEFWGQAAIAVRDGLTSPSPRVDAPTLKMFREAL